MKRYSIFHPLILSFFSTSLYRDVGRNWRGIGLSYLLLLLFITWTPHVIKDYIAARKREPMVTAFVNQFPRVEIKNGEVSCDAPMPYIIRDMETNEPAIIIDTTGETTDLNNTPAEWLLTKTQLIYKDENSLTGATEMKTIDLSGISSFYFDRDRVASFFTFFKYAVFPLLFLFSLAYRLVQVLIYGVIGLIFKNTLKVNLSYQALVRLSVIAITPALLFDTLIGFLNLPMGIYMCGGGLLSFLVSMGYLFFGVKANSEPRRGELVAA